MVKYETRLTPDEARSFLESIADDRNPRVKVVHNKRICMIKVPAGQINASIKGKNGFSLVTMTYSMWCPKAYPKNRRL